MLIRNPHPHTSEKLMILPRLTRRRFLSAGACTALAATSRPSFAQQPSETAHPAPTPSTPANNPLERQLDSYIAAYMPAMNAPGMTLGLTDSSKTLRTVGYGLANIDAKLPVTPDHLFQIGSITKSFVALVLMQLRDEGKLDVHKPVLDYLPWLPITESFGPITVHHLLTHTSGLPDASDLFLTAPEARHIQGFAPGEHFHYCNLGFVILGRLAVKLDGRPWYECVKARIFTPLEMHDTQSVIATPSRPRAAIGYSPFWDDQTYARQGQLAVADYLVTDDTAGCIESTPADMARYLRMMLNHGNTPAGSAASRIVSAESFTLFSTPYIKADEFSPTAFYGYGIAVDTLDGHKILRHTGGMIAFASSIHVDLDGGVAAFASINAMQGYRPTAVTQYAVRLLRAQREAKPLPAAEPLHDPEAIKNAADYAGTYKAEDGSELVFQESAGHDGATRLSLLVEGKSIPLQNEGDSFISTIPGSFADYDIVFKRGKTPATSTGKDSAPTEKVIQVSYGSKWYAGKNYSGPRSFPVPDDYLPFVGRYRAQSIWGGDVRVFVLQGRLVLSDATLTPIGGNLFHIGDEPWNPDTVEFLSIADGKAHLMKMIGMDLWRIELP
jgi:D-alanyl-D-alanine carboxypeptidase